MRRAARWDGVVPLFTDARHGHVPPVHQVRELVAYVRKQRGDSLPDAPFEIVLGGATPGGDAAATRAVVEPLAEAGATWWDERQIRTSEAIDRLEPVLRRIEQGPPHL
jgi:hypothetical protein